MIRKNDVFGIATAIVLAASAAQAAELHVGPGQPYTTIQSAIDGAANGDTVIVADGTYTGDGNRDIDFKGKAITVRSENGPENCVIDCEATQQEQHRGFYFHSNETTQSTVKGFTVINGYDGAIRLEGSGATVDNCILAETVRGPGIDTRFDANLIMNNCLIQKNDSWGVACLGGSATITGCRISENNNSGIFCQDSTLTVTASQITSNITRYGGYAGGIDCRRAEITLRGCYITRNHGSRAGGLFLGSGAVATITNTTIAANVGNAGGLYLNASSEAVITNTIFWENVYSPEFGSPIKLYYGQNKLTLSYCLLQDGIDATSAGDADIVQVGPGNIQGDARLIRDYFHLLADSPCINAGDPAFDASELPTDIDGEPRIDAGRVDMGVDEFIDTDIDGLPDWFEQVASGSATEATPQGNPDSDSFSNSEEYLRGANPAVSSDLYVDSANGDDSYNGFAPDFDGVSGPKRTVQAAIDACEGGQVIVKPGTYTGDGNRDIDFKGKLITVHGVDPLDPDVVASTIIDCQGTETEYHRGFTFHSGENRHSILAGLSIINGTSDLIGAGIHCVSSSPTIRNCIVRNNRIFWYGNTGFGGAGIYCSPIAPMIISDCVISDNYALKEGAGIVVAWGPVSIIRCTFERNESKYGPSALYVYYGNCIIDQCIFARNRTTSTSANTVLISGQGANVSLLNSLICYNESGDTWQKLINLSAVDCTGTIRNCTIVDNQAGAIVIDGLVANSVFWGNNSQDILLPGLPPWPTVSYCNIEQGWTGPGGNNISLDPLFVDAPNGDFHLAPASPCINAGLLGGDYVGMLDIDRQRRVLRGRVDIGADEVPYAGDFEPDDDVDIADFAAFAPWWMQTGCDAANAFCNGADLVPDDWIGPPDLVMLTANWLNGFPLDQPFGYWRLDEAAGSLALDAAPHALHGTLTNMDDTDWVQGKVGNALEFDGVDDFVEITGFAGLLGGQSRTVCAWIKVDSVDDVYRAIVSWGNDNTGGLWLFMLDNSGYGHPGSLRLAAAGGTITGVRDLRDGLWHHVAAVLEDDGSANVSEVLFYIDGAPEEINISNPVAINTGDTSGGVAANDVRIGARNRAGSEMYFEGLIDDVRIYDRPLSAEEIATLAQ